MRKCFFAFILIWFFIGIPLIKVEAKSKIKVLLLSGNNNHNWKKTTPALKNILTNSQLFEVLVTEKPEQINTDILSDYQLILSNWNDFPNQNCKWSETTKSAILNFIKQGGGILFIHSASSAHTDWKAFQELSGSSWRKGTRHGKMARFEVNIRDVNHPITKGMSNFFIHDELWVNMYNTNTCNVLGEAFAPKSNKGMDKMEPVMFERTYAKGRSFNLILGHNEQVMKNIGFKTLLLRGAEWAATGKVKQAIPDELKAPSACTKLSWKKEKSSLSLMNNERVVWQYNFDVDEGKPYFHPLSTSDGTLLTALRPLDHPWHRGIWHSWKYINGINYWEEDRKTGISEGTTEIKTVSYTKTKQFGAEFKLSIGFRLSGEADILQEDRIIKVSPLDENGNYYIDWQSTSIAMADEVVLDRTPILGEDKGKAFGGYAGFSARLNTQLSNVVAINDKSEQNDLHGSTSKWINFQMKSVLGKPASLVILDHPENMNHPSKWYITINPEVPFYYFSPAVLFSNKFVLKKGEKFTLKYRLLVNNKDLSQHHIQQVYDEYVLQ